MSRVLTGECGMLARLLDADETIRAIVLAKVRSGAWLTRGRAVVATPRRVLLVRKAMITRRERVRDIPLESIRGARVKPPGSLELELQDEVLRLSWVMPPRQLAALADAARGGRDPDRFATLQELARRKLGRSAGFAYEGSLLALTEELDPREQILDLALGTGSPGGLLAACDTRLVVIPDKGFGSGPPTSIAFHEIAEIRAEEADLVVRTAQSEHRFADLVPNDRAGVIAARVDVRRPGQDGE